MVLVWLAEFRRHCPKRYLLPSLEYDGSMSSKICISDFVVDCLFKTLKNLCMEQGIHLGWKTSFECWIHEELVLQMHICTNANSYGTNTYSFQLGVPCSPTFRPLSKAWAPSVPSRFSRGFSKCSMSIRIFTQVRIKKAKDVRFFIISIQSRSE